MEPLRMNNKKDYLHEKEKRIKIKEMINFRKQKQGKRQVWQEKD